MPWSLDGVWLLAEGAVLQGSVIVPTSVEAVYNELPLICLKPAVLDIQRHTSLHPQTVNGTQLVRCALHGPMVHSARMAASSKVRQQ